MALVSAKQTEPSLYLFAKDLNIAAKKWEDNPGPFQAVAAFSLSQIIESAIEILNSVRSLTAAEKYGTSIIEIDNKKACLKFKDSKKKERADIYN